RKVEAASPKLVGDDGQRGILRARIEGDFHSGNFKISYLCPLKSNVVGGACGCRIRANGLLRKPSATPAGQGAAKPGPQIVSEPGERASADCHGSFAKNPRVARCRPERTIKRKQK
ncbi:hypothetical protein, partial [Millionella massiliensis]|uniref:hypothetical protein n=1 Tax=Millionella massiliensis TaxID=1871023 RepID=UPI0023A84BAF